MGQDRRTNQFFARNIQLLDKSLSSSKAKRFRGVISTMKDSFGFIEREDALKEIFFHVTEFGSNVQVNTIQPGVEVEFDIQDRHVNALDFTRQIHSILSRTKKSLVISLFYRKVRFNLMKLIRFLKLVEFFNHYKLKTRIQMKI